MGVADVEASAALCKRLYSYPFCDLVRILKQTDIGEGLYLIHVYSPLLPRGYNYSQEIAIDGDHVRFKVATDT